MSIASSPRLNSPPGATGLVSAGRARTAAAVVATAAATAASTAALTARHRRRLRDVYRSAGWPCQDLLEIELLAEGLIERVRGPLGHETLRVTEAGIAILAETLRRNQARRDPHEALVERVAREMTRAGRIAWRGLSLRAQVDGRWGMAMPDVFSLRDTTVAAYACPIVHEIKVHRADLLSDLRSHTKRAAYLALSSECWYAVRAGIARPEEIPMDFGVLIATETGLEVARSAPKRPMEVPFGLWMVLAKSTPVEGWRRGEEQGFLGDANASLDLLEASVDNDRPMGPADFSLAATAAASDTPSAANR